MGGVLARKGAEFSFEVLKGEIDGEGAGVGLKEGFDD